MHDRNPKKDDWVFFYRIQGLPYLITDLWLKNYGGILALHDGTTHLGFIHGDYIEQALDEGRALFTDEQEYSRYAESFQEAMDLVPDFLDRFRSEPITSEFWSEYVAFTRELAKHYEKMEWYYTDILYKENIQPAIIKKVEHLKQAGRGAANKMILEEDFELFIERLAKHLDVDADTIFQSNTREIADALEGKGHPLNKQRANGFGLLWNGNGYDELGAKAAEKLHRLFDSAPKGSTIKGTVASKGKVRGVASVIPNLYDKLNDLYALIEVMPQGNILVASTTSPEYTAALKKAAAVVTNEGGLGSHAAIVSREFGIPCIVGTKNATQLIKDGDEVEVDADEGVVTIMS